MQTKTHESSPNNHETISKPDIKIDGKVFRFISNVRKPGTKANLNILGTHVETMSDLNRGKIAADRNVYTFFRELAKRRIGILPETQATDIYSKPVEGYYAFYQNRELPELTWVEIENALIKEYPAGQDPFGGIGQGANEVLTQTEVSEMVGDVLNKWQFSQVREFSEAATSHTGTVN